MNASQRLSQITIATPCPVNWESMDGDEQKRYCRHCNRHVYNLSAMNSDELVELIRTTEGQFGGQIFGARMVRW